MEKKRHNLENKEVLYPRGCQQGWQGYFYASSAVPRISEKKKGKRTKEPTIGPKISFTFLTEKYIKCLATVLE